MNHRTATYRAHRPASVPENAVLVEAPFSEVCMHMKIAGYLMWTVPLEHGMAQLYTVAGDKFSMPITRGEAGLGYD